MGEVGGNSNTEVEMKKKKKMGRKIRGVIAVMDQRVLKKKKNKRGN